MDVLKKLFELVISFFNRELSTTIVHRKRELPPPIFDRLRELNFKVHTAGDYNLNIIGVRTLIDKPNKFNDYLYCVYKVSDKWIQHRWNITTDPGIYWLKHLSNKMGTACVVADRQYKGVWKLGKHRDKYKALVQTGNKIAVYRDNDRDPRYNFDKNTIVEGYFGINLHRATTATGGSVNVDKWSAGCQVFQKPDDFKKFIEICEKQVGIRGWDKFSYTLLNEWCTLGMLDWDNE